MGFRIKGKYLYYDKKKIFASSTQIKKILVVDLGCIVVSEYNFKRQGEPQSNVWLVNKDGKLIWQLPLPPRSHKNGADDYVDVEYIEGILRVWTFGCFRYTLNPDTGELSDELFTK